MESSVTEELESVETQSGVICEPTRESQRGEALQSQELE